MLCSCKSSTIYIYILSRVLISLLRQAVTSFAILHIYHTYNSAGECVKGKIHFKILSILKLPSALVCIRAAACSGKSTRYLV